MRSFTVKENLIGLAVSEILHYTQTDKQTDILLLFYIGIMLKKPNLLASLRKQDLVQIYFVTFHFCSVAQPIFFRICLEYLFLNLNLQRGLGQALNQGYHNVIPLLHFKSEVFVNMLFAGTMSGTIFLFKCCLQVNE